MKKKMTLILMIVLGIMLSACSTEQVFCPKLQTYKVEKLGNIKYEVSKTEN